MNDSDLLAGIFEQQVQPYSPEDLEAFFKNFMPEANSCK